MPSKKEDSDGDGSSQPTLRHLTSPEYGKIRKEQVKSLQDLVKHHVESFNFMLEKGLPFAVQSLPSYELMDSDNRKISLFLEDVKIGSPTLPESNVHSSSIKIFPSECRQRNCTYRGKLSLTFKWLVNGVEKGTLTRTAGQVPIMVKSDRCRLALLSPRELVKAHEEAEEFGGYFIVNGNERLIRMLIMTRRNYPLAINRPSWKKRGSLFTEHGIIMRCVRKDQSSANLTLHYLTDGSCVLQFSKNKQLFFIPVVYVLKALIQTTDLHIFKELTKGNEDDTFLKGCVSSMLRAAQEEGLTSHQAVLKYVGERFRIKAELPPWTSDEDVTRHLLMELVLVHLNKNGDKFNMLIFMTRKLYALALGRCAAESADSPSNQEVLLGGHLYLMVLKEKLDSYLRFAKYELERLFKSKSEKSLDQLMSKVLSSGPDIGQHMEYFLATGNLRSRTGLGLQQQSGFTVVAEKLNFYRYLSHFRAVHRGAFFSTMRTTTVRKLLPEAWGFLCPVHTPDGAPCGLLNHLAAQCEITTDTPSVSGLPQLLVSLGMTPMGAPFPCNYATPPLAVILDGRIIGEMEETHIKSLTSKLRTLKALGDKKVPAALEVAFVPCLPQGQYPGLYLFSTPARMMRPVVNLATKTHELIGSFEQMYMDIAIIPEEAHEGHTTHMELNEGSMLSAIASLTPFSDCNQSPRNMYQCQMGKQTMGTPLHSYPYRMDSKLYRLQTPQVPIVRPATYNHYEIDEYPLGTNAIVAVISYTGYDMEDAMILNKASVERGLAHASIYKTDYVDLTKVGAERGRVELRFGSSATEKAVLSGSLELDGFPSIGTYLTEGDPYYSYFNETSGKVKVVYYHSNEPAYVDQINILGGENGEEPLQKAFIKLRLNRNPVIGDKFASRAGQKGICSQKWPVENMPFTESGMMPDIIFNPHGFPSRMTIGMMIETMAGKSGALHGLCHDCTPFTFSEDNPAIKHFGKLLVHAGYNYYGNERLYSGTDGREFEADIFMGVVYYQRLRHMVSDKFQVRTTGPIDILTHQPVKGRRRAGGIRFGEMERDSLLAHGSSFLLQDRLLNCSDRSFSRICKSCGSMLSPLLEKVSPTHLPGMSEWRCQACPDGGHIEVVSVPYVFRYLVAELAAMNIRVDIETS